MKNAFWTIFKTEAKLSIRGGDMVFFGVIFPAAVMLLVGCISGAEAMRAGFAGIAAIGICAAGLMGIPLTFASYRHEKILKRLKVTPVSPLLLFLSVTLVQTLFAWASALAVYLIARIFFKLEMTGSLLRFGISFLFVQFSVYSLGFMIASLVPNTKTANLVCAIVYFPTLFLSGATVPYEIMPRALRYFADVFPLTQGIKLLKGAVFGLDPAADFSRIIVLSLIAVVSYILSLLFFRWE